MSQDNKDKEDKKDLTTIMQLSKRLLDEGNLPEAPQGAAMEEAPIEKIDQFESLEDYAAKNPNEVSKITEPTPAQAQPSVPAEPPPVEPPASNEFETSPPPPADGDAFNTTSPAFEEAQAQTEFSPPAFDAPSEGQNEIPNEFPTELPQEAPPQPQPNLFVSPPSEAQATEAQPEFATDPSPTPVASDLAPPSLADEGAQFSSSPQSDFPEPEPDPTPEPETNPEIEVPKVQSKKAPQIEPSAVTPPSGPKSTLDKIKTYSENLVIAKPAVPAAFPFSLLIDGKLLPEEKEKLLDILSRENMGIREIDLEPQLEMGKILIPRISEYAGVMLIQALRGVRAKIKFGPSDSFSPHDSDEEKNSDQNEVSVQFSSDSSHLAEQIPISTLEEVPDLKNFTVVDVIIASAVLQSKTVEAENTSEYREILEALQREIKYKAHYKGATAIVAFKVQMHALSSPTHYRIVAIGNAIKSAPQRKPQANAEGDDLVSS